MTSRVEEGTLRVRPARLQARKAAARTLSGVQRLLFTMALFTFGLASIYTSVVLLARVYPAVFPGKDLGDLTSAVLPVSLDLGPKIGIKAPGTNSVFNQRINLLIMGVDHRAYGDNDDKLPEEVRFAGLTDTIMVATIDPVAKTMSFLGFPRDMVIDTYLPGQRPYQTRINESFVHGLNGGKSADAGAKQLETDLEKNFGIEINYYVIMNFRGVEKLVNAVGGVDIDIPYELTVPSWFYSDDEIHGRYVSFGSGVQHLDGYHAVAFGRNRDPSDFARVKRQQLVLKGAISKAFSQGLLDPTAWPDLWDAYSTTVKTDMPKSKMAGMMPLVKDTNGRSNMFSLGDPVDGKPTVWTGQLGDASVVFWDSENVQYWLSQVFTKAAYSNVTVEIQNGYGDDGAVRAASLGRYLAYSKGLSTVYYGPDQAPQPETTIILYDDQKKVPADDIAKWLNVSSANYTTRSKNGDETLPDVVIIIGRNYKIPG